MLPKPILKGPVDYCPCDKCNGATIKNQCQTQQIHALFYDNVFCSLL